jgi:PAS domain S-box-containing protein
LRFLDINETECLELGYSREEMLSMGPTDIDPAFTPTVNEELQSQLQKSGSAQFETMHRRKDGSVYPIECSMKTVELDRPYVLNIVRNISERKRAETTLQDSEERLRAIFDGALDGIALVNLETKQFVETNSALCHMLGYSPEEFVQLKVTDIHPQKDLPNVLEQFNKQVRGEISLATDLPVKRKDGSEFYADINTATVKLGGKHFIVGIFRDITERKRVEADLAEQLEELRRWYETTQGREARILELKHEVNALLGQAGQPPRYPSAELPEPKEQ